MRPILASAGLQGRRSHHAAQAAARNLSRLSPLSHFYRQSVTAPGRSLAETAPTTTVPRPRPRLDSRISASSLAGLQPIPPVSQKTTNRLLHNVGTSRLLQRALPAPSPPANFSSRLPERPTLPPAGRPQTALPWQSRISAGALQKRHSSTDNHNPDHGSSSSSSSSSTGLPPKPAATGPLAKNPTPPERFILRKPGPAHSYSHRPTKEDLLAAASGFWSRLKVHFKWFSIKSSRPFNVDDISAFFSWIILGHFVWIILGTTTFFSLAILLVNTVFAQETLGRWVGNYLTQASGLQVVFESAIVPKWNDGVISFKRVFVSKRPGKGRSKVSKGSQAEAAAAAAEAVAAVDGTPPQAPAEREEEEEDSNYTQFDLSVDTINVTLSFAKWFNGKGLLRDVEVIGVRGVVDRTSVRPAEPGVHPHSYKHTHSPGDFEIDSFKLEDLLVTVYQPDNFRPFPVSIYSCQLPRLRKRWLFYDFLCANSMHGSFDNSLFTIHSRQDSHYLRPAAADGSDSSAGPDSSRTLTHSSSQALSKLHQELTRQPQQSCWKRQNRIRIDALPIDHLNYGIEGPFSWIREGHVDVVADISFPLDEPPGIVFSNERAGQSSSSDSGRNSNSNRNAAEVHYAAAANERLDGSVEINYDSLSRVVSEVYDRVEAVALGDAPLSSLTVSSSLDLLRVKEPRLVLDLQLNLSNIRAAVPLFSSDLSYINTALVRPIVGYLNAHRGFVPVKCQVRKGLSDFDGSWTMYDSGLMDDLSLEAYEAFVRNIRDDEDARRRRIRKVGLWTIQLAAQALFVGLVGHIA